MEKELKYKVIRFLQKIVNGLPGVAVKDIESEAFILEMQVRMSNKDLTLEAPKELQPMVKHLTDSQLEHYRTVKWLLNPMGPRGVGRTALMALAFIQHSLNYNTWVIVFDHSIGAKGMAERIKKIVEQTEGLKLSIKTHPGGCPEIKVERIQKESKNGK